MLDIEKLIKLELSGLAFKVILAINFLKLETQKEIDDLLGCNNNQVVNRVLNILIAEGVLESQKVIGRTKFYQIAAAYKIGE